MQSTRKLSVVLDGLFEGLREVFVFGVLDHKQGQHFGDVVEFQVAVLQKAFRTGLILELFFFPVKHETVVLAPALLLCFLETRRRNVAGHRHRLSDRLLFGLVVNEIRQDYLCCSRFRGVWVGSFLVLLPLFDVLFDLAQQCSTLHAHRILLQSRQFDHSIDVAVGCGCLL